MADDDTIAGPHLELSADSKKTIKAFQDAIKSGEDFEKAVAKMNRELGKIKGDRIARLGADIQGSGATKKLKDIELAVKGLDGGIGKLSGANFDRLISKIQKLETAGGRVPASLKQLTTGLEQLQAAGAKGGLGDIIKAEALGKVEGLTGGLGSFGSALTKIGPAGVAAGAGIAVTVGIATAAAKAMLDAADAATTWAAKTTDTAATLSTTTDQVQRLEYAARASGTSFDAVTAMVGKLNAELVDSPGRFERIGLSVDQLRAMDPVDMFAAVGTALAGMSDQGEQAAASNDLFGKSWQTMAPLIKGGLDAMKDAKPISAEMVKALNDLKTESNKLSFEWDKLWISLGAALVGGKDAPEVLKNLSTAVADFSQTIRDAAPYLQLLVKVMGGDLITAGIGIAKAQVAPFATAGRLIAGSTGSAGALAGGAAAALAIPESSRKASEAGTKALTDAERALAEARAKSLPALEQQLEAIDQATAAKIREINANEKLQRWEKDAAIAILQQAAAVDKLTAKREEATRATERSIQAEEAKAKDLENLHSAISEHSLKTKKDIGETESLSAPDVELTAREKLDAQIKEYTKNYVQAAKDRVHALEAEADKLQDIGSIFSQLGGMVSQLHLGGGTLGAAGAAVGVGLGGAAGFLGASSNLKNLNIKNDALIAKGEKGISTTEMKAAKNAKNMAMGAAAGGVLNAGAEMAGGPKSGAGRALAGAAKGAQIGAIAGPWGMAAGAVIGAVIGGLNKPEWVKVAEDVGKRWGVNISDGLAKAIAETEKSKKVSRQMAELLHLGDIMAESEDDPSKFADKIGDLFNATALGAVKSKDGIKGLGKAFTDLKTAADGGSIASEKAMVAMIHRAKELTLSIPEIDDAVRGMLQEAKDNLEAFFKGQGSEILTKMRNGSDADSLSGPVSAAQAQANAAIFGAVFDATAALDGLVVAAEDTQAAFDEFMRTLPEGTKLTGGAAKAALVNEALKNPLFRGAAETAAAGGKILKALGGSDNLSQEVVDAFGTTLQSGMEQALAGTAGLNLTADDQRRLAEQANLPLLAQLQHAETMGARLSRESSAILAQAQRDGILPLKTLEEQTFQEAQKQTSILQQIRDGQKGEPPAPGGGGTGGTGGTGSGTGTGSGPTTPPTNYPGPANAASGGYVNPRAGGTLIRVGEAGEGEFITPISQMARLHDFGSGAFMSAAAAVGRSAGAPKIGASINRGGGTEEIHIHVSLDGKEIDRFLIRRKRAGFFEEPE